MSLLLHRVGIRLAPLSVKHTERVPSRLAQDALSLLASIERVL